MGKKVSLHQFNNNDFTTTTTMITEMIAALGIIFRWKNVQCLVFVVILTGLVAPLGVCGAPLQCPPGGQYFDKHLGQWGKYACCSELCQPPGYFPDQCSKKCPNYEKDKHVNDSPPDNDNTNPSTLALYILIPVAVLLLLLVFVVRIRQVRDRGWRGLLPTIFPQRVAPGVRDDGENVVLQDNTPPPRTPAEDGDVGQNLLDNPQPEDGEVGQNLPDDSQAQERAQDAEDRFPEGGSRGGNPVGGVCGGPARGGRQLCQTAKEEAPPIQEQGQEADQAVAIC